MYNKVYYKPLSTLNNLPSGSRINLVLSGGGEKGVAHIALLEKIEELGLVVNEISACSVGTLVGGMYCSGLKPKEIYNFFKHTKLINYSWFTIKKPGIFKSENYEKLIDGYIKKTFESLDIPLTVVATNIEAGQVEYFNHGNTTNPILASCAVPGVFNPIEINGTYYSDGSIMDNFPIYPFLDKELPIIGSYVGRPNLKTKNELNSIIKVSSQAAKLLAYAVDQPKFFNTYLTVTFPVGDFSGFDIKMVEPIYQKAKAYLEG